MISRLLIALLVPFILSAQQLLDGVAAIVGENVILHSDIVQTAQLIALQNGVDIYSNPNLLLDFQAIAFDELILQNIFLDRARVDSVNIIPDEEVDLTLDQQIDAYLAEVGTEVRFEEMMGQSLRDFREDYWYVIRDQMIAERYQSQLMQSVGISRPEVIEFYNTYKDSLGYVEDRYEISQLIIPIRPGQSSKDQAYQEATHILDQLSQGVPFEDLAQEYSDDLATNQFGGDLGFVRRGEFILDFEEVAFDMEPGQVSGVVETDFGYHIIELLEKQGERIHARHILIIPEATDQDRIDALEKTREYYFLSTENPALFDSLVDVIAAIDDPPMDLGYIGWVNLSNLPGDAYVNALFGSRAGEITFPFEESDGFHLLKVINFREGGVPTLEEFYPQIEEFALRQKQYEYLLEWREHMLNEVLIKTLSEFPTSSIYDQ